MPFREHLPWLITVSGYGHLGLIIGSLAIPKVLGWEEQLRLQRPLLRQVFWTYAAYIWSTNLWFGLVSIFATEALVHPSPLGAFVSGFITLYWGARIGIQIFYYDRNDAPKGPLVPFGEALLFLLFIGFTGVYGVAFLHQVGALD